MINRVAALTDPDVAVICGLPMAAAVANPELLTVASVLSEEVQVTEAVTSDVLPSLKEPVATSCCVDPAVTEKLAGVIWMDVNVLGGGGGEDCEPQPAIPAMKAAVISKPPIRETVNQR
jgi:hypothetical protein